MRGKCQRCRNTQKEYTLSYFTWNVMNRKMKRKRPENVWKKEMGKHLLFVTWLNALKARLNSSQCCQRSCSFVQVVCSGLGHPWNLQGRITCDWLRANSVDHHLPIFANSFSRCESLQINSAFA